MPAVIVFIIAILHVILAVTANVHDERVRCSCSSTERATAYEAVDPSSNLGENTGD
jgi:hypothetical protein